MFRHTMSGVCIPSELLQVKCNAYSQLDSKLAEFESGQIGATALRQRTHRRTYRTRNKPEGSQEIAALRSLS